MFVDSGVGHSSRVTGSSGSEEYWKHFALSHKITEAPGVWVGDYGMTVACCGDEFRPCSTYVHESIVLLYLLFFAEDVTMLQGDFGPISLSLLDHLVSIR